MFAYLNDYEKYILLINQSIKQTKIGKKQVITKK